MRRSATDLPSLHDGSRRPRLDKRTTTLRPDMPDDDYLHFGKAPAAQMLLRNKPPLRLALVLPIKHLDLHRQERSTVPPAYCSSTPWQIDDKIIPVFIREHVGGF